MKHRRAISSSPSWGLGPSGEPGIYWGEYDDDDDSEPVINLSLIQLFSGAPNINHSLQVMYSELLGKAVIVAPNFNLIGINLYVPSENLP